MNCRRAWQLAASYGEPIGYATPKGNSLLIENNGWLKDDPNAVSTVLSAVGEGFAAAPVTGNWTERARFAGLAKALPHAVLTAVQNGGAGRPNLVALGC